MTGLHRKAAIRRFAALARGRPRSRGGRPTVFGPGVTAALADLWQLSGEICAERLHPQIGEYVRVLRANPRELKAGIERRQKKLLASRR